MGAVIAPVWYRDPTKIRQKVNQDWTPQEREIILSMREQGYPVAEIIGVFKKTRTLTPCQVHNQTRMARALVEKRCHICRRKLTKRDIRESKTKKNLYVCVSCRKKEDRYKAQLRKEALEQGLCGICHKRKRYKGSTMCIKCTSHTHRHRILKGLCSACGKEPIADTSVSLGASCLEKNRVRSRQYRRDTKRAEKRKRS